MSDRVYDREILLLALRAEAANAADVFLNSVPTNLAPILSGAAGVIERDTSVLEDLLELLEGVDEFYTEALGLLRELSEDALTGRTYLPEKGWPPHIEKARNLGDHEETLRQVASALKRIKDLGGDDGR